MLSWFRPRLTYANVTATLGVFLGLGGGAYAVSTTLPKNSVGTEQIKDAAVTRPKIRGDAVTGRKVKNKSLTGADVVASTLGKVPAATSSDQLGGAPASAFQRQVTTVCPDAA